jgi:hypothetical protein
MMSADQTIARSAKLPKTADIEKQSLTADERG